MIEKVIGNILSIFKLLKYTITNIHEEILCK